MSAYLKFFSRHLEEERFFYNGRPLCIVGGDAGDAFRTCSAPSMTKYVCVCVCVYCREGMKETGSRRGSERERERERGTEEGTQPRIEGT